MDAVLRRLESARKDKLRVESRPAEGRLLGIYVTRRPGSGSRPYRTVLHGVDPIEGRCDCPDFVKNSLGLCKHILVVLEHLYARPRLLQQAKKEQEWSDPQTGNGLCWDPIRPLTGLGDWLERVVWSGDVEPAKQRGRHGSRTALKWFRSSKDGPVASLKNSLLGQTGPAARAGRGPAQGGDRRAPSGSRHDPALRALLESEQQAAEAARGAGLSPPRSARRSRA